ncbi:unnamed protein product [Trichobilharzia szidati]|nr:unnamed protein product [Trichobilharzia szidati]
MACILALRVCLAVSDSHDEGVLLSSLSSIKNQLKQGFKYFSQNNDADTISKENVRRFVKRIAAYLNLSEFLSREILVHFLANQDIPEDQIDLFITGRHVNRLLEDIRQYYWKERLSLLRLLKLCLCQWHSSWSLTSDVLFAMTSYNSRKDLIIEALSEYLNEHYSTVSLITSWPYTTYSLALDNSVKGAEEYDQFNIIVEQRLKELVELLELILLGIHGVHFSATSENPSLLFTKILETFWSVSFGSSFWNLKTHRMLVEQVWLTQTFILIRAANLDSLALYSDKLSYHPTTLSQKSKKESIVHTPKRKSTTENTSVKKVEVVTSESTSSAKDSAPTHFLYDSCLLNRLLASLSNLGEHQVHGPFLLFGAVCAAVFGYSEPHSRNKPNQSSDSTYEPFDHKELRITNDLLSISNHCAQLAIKNLDVFHFLTGKLDQIGCQPPQVLPLDSGVSVHYDDRSHSLVSLSAYSAVFDLITLLARDITLWSLDNGRPPSVHLFDSFDYPNRDSFLTLFSRTLRVVVSNAHYACYSPSKEGPKISADINTAVDSGPRIGCRIFGLIESLMESFPFDLSVLRIYTSLLSHSNYAKTKSGGSDLINHVKDLTNHVPYLAEPLTEALIKQITPRGASLYPQLTSNVEEKSSIQVVLDKPRAVMNISPKTSLAPSNLSEKFNIFCGVHLTSGTHGYVNQDLGLVVWRVEYPLWHIIGSEIYATESAFTDFDKSINSSPQKYESHIPINASQNACKSLQIQAEYYVKFYVRLTRMVELVNFISACLQCDMHITPCLISLEYIWVIIMRYLNVVPSSKVSVIIQYLINTSTFVKTHQKVFASKMCSNGPNVNCNPIDDLITTSLLPSLLRLFGHSLLNLPTLNSKQSIIGTINLLTNVLSSSVNLMPRMIINQTNKSQSFTFGLTSCYLLNNILGYHSSEPIYSYNLHKLSPLCIRPVDYNLLISYINFISGLFIFVRWEYTNSKFIIENVKTDYLPLYIECSELIHGCLVFIIQCLMTTGLQVDYRLKSVNHGASVITNPPRVDFYQLANLAEHCFILLTDVLTTYISDEDVQILQMSLKHFKQGASTSSSYLCPKFIFEEKHWTVAHQFIALHLLFSDARPLTSLIGFSSIHLSVLLRQTEATENGFPMSVYPSGSDLSDTRGIDSPVIRAVWLALTLIHHLLGLENKLIGEPENSNSSISLLKSIQSYHDPLTNDPYITTLFSYLRYPYSSGISRLVVAVLKWIVQYSSVELTNYLGDQANQIRTSCLKRLTSTTEDQLTRIGLYDLLSEEVLNSGKIATANFRLMPTGILSLLLTINLNNINAPDIKFNILTTSSKETTETDCLDCTLDTLKELQTTFTQKLRSDDRLSSVLYWSVTKFVSSLYLVDIQSCIARLQKQSDFWKILTDPLFTILKLQESEKAEPLSDIENELCGNVISVLALELYNKSSSTPEDKSFECLTSVLNYMTKNNLYQKWFKLTLNCLNNILSSSKSKSMPVDRVHSRLTSLHNVICRWKCLLMLNYNAREQPATDSTETDKRKKQTNYDFASIAVSILSDLIECFTPLRDLPYVQSTLDLGNQLATTLTTTLTYIYKAYNSKRNRNEVKNELSTDDLFSYLNKLNNLLSSFRISIDAQIQHMHSDLLASVYLLLELYKLKTLDAKATNNEDMVSLQSSLFSNAVYYLSIMTRNPNRSKPEESAILQSINLIILLWDECRCPTLFTCLTETGVLNNIFIMLTECTKVKENAVLCHSLISLLVKLVTSSCHPANDTIVSTNKSLQIPSPDTVTTADLDENSKEYAKESNDVIFVHQKNTIAQLIVSYHEYISEAFYWPELDVLLQWVQDSEENFKIQDDSFINDGEEHHLATWYIQHDWFAVYMLEIQLLCLLHDTLGGMKHPLVSSIIQNFCTDNASQLKYLISYWCSPLYTTSVYDQSFMSSLPVTSVLIQQGILSNRRIQIADIILQLYWRLLVASERIPASGLPIIASTILYPNQRRIENNRELPRQRPSYGPTVHSELFNSIFNLVQCQIHCCSVLFQRHGFEPLKNIPNTLLHTMATKFGTNNQPTSISSAHSFLLPKSPAASKPTDVSSPYATSSSVSIDPSNSQTSGLELLCLVRHLVTSLSVLMVQLPILSNTAFMTSEELKHLNVPVDFIFKTPNFGDNSRGLTFGVLITLVNSLYGLSSKLASLWKLDQSTESITTTQEKKREICCLLQRAYEMVLSIVMSQSTIFLKSPSTTLYAKQVLIRELTTDLKTCSSAIRRSINRSSSTHRRLGSLSPLPAVSNSSGSSSIPVSDSSNFDKAASRFIELLRLNL